MVAVEHVLQVLCMEVLANQLVRKVILLQEQQVAQMAALLLLQHVIVARQGFTNHPKLAPLQNVPLVNLGV